MNDLAKRAAAVAELRAKATEGPMRTHEDRNGAVVILGPGSWTVAQLMLTPDWKGPGNADFIVHAYNEHTQLIADQQAEIERIGRNRDMWKGQVERQAAEIARLRALVSEAVEEIEHWGSYASEYFQGKHGLAGNVKSLRERAQMSDDTPNTRDAGPTAFGGRTTDRERT